MTADPLFDADLASRDTFWADMRNLSIAVNKELLLIAADVDEYALEVTRYGMRQDGAL